MRRFSAVIAAVTLTLAALIPFGPSGAAHADTTPPGSFSTSKTVSRVNINADGSQTTVDSRTVKISIDQTTQLRGRQDINVTWSGAKPTGRVTGNYNSADAPNQEYPMVILECRDTSGGGTSTPNIDPTTCWTHGWQSRFQADRTTGYGPWRLDRYATTSQRDAIVGRPNPEPAACVLFDSTTPSETWVPFVAVDGTSYPYGPGAGCGGIPPEDYTVDQTSASIPSNATFATTAIDGTGTDTFDISTAAENASLGCSDTVACSLVVIPVEGISCDLAGAGVPAADMPPASVAQQAGDTCEKTGSYQPGQVASGGQAPDLAVSGSLWWSASNWRNRIVVPLSFAPPANVCDIKSSAQPVDVYGSELMTEAAIQWAPAFCLDPKLFKFNHVQTDEQLARTLVANKGVEAAFSAKAPDGGAAGFNAPTVQAPVAVTGFSISYRIDDAQGQPYTDLKMTPRLLAKLMTESYTQEPAIAAAYTALAGNPQSITADPEFKALNPGIPINYADPAAAALLA
ncbi:MAG: hypothetical protein JO147_02895, partial [Actinobacteria bacterium]|nr:hypothetical protein [Actinomycetota bacterium]